VCPKKMARTTFAPHFSDFPVGVEDRPLLPDGISHLPLVSDYDSWFRLRRR
jgi:hypothetical protein